MQMLHTHVAVQASEGGSNKQLVGGQFKYKTRYPPKAVLTEWNWQREEKHERL